MPTSSQERSFLELRKSESDKKGNELAATHQKLTKTIQQNKRALENLTVRIERLEREINNDSLRKHVFDQDEKAKYKADKNLLEALKGDEKQLKRTITQSEEKLRNTNAQIEVNIKTKKEIVNLLKAIPVQSVEKSALASVEPAPASVEPAPASVEPAPASVDSAPVSVEPASVSSELPSQLTNASAEPEARNVELKAPTTSNTQSAHSDTEETLHQRKLALKQWQNKLNESDQKAIDLSNNKQTLPGKIEGKKQDLEKQNVKISKLKNEINWDEYGDEDRKRTYRTLTNEAIRTQRELEALETRLSKVNIELQKNERTQQTIKKEIVKLESISDYSAVHPDIASVPTHKQRQVADFMRGIDPVSKSTRIVTEPNASLSAPTSRNQQQMYRETLHAYKETEATHTEEQHLPLKVNSSSSTKEKEPPSQTAENKHNQLWRQFNSTVKEAEAVCQPKLSAGQMNPVTPFVTATDPQKIKPTSDVLVPI